MGDRLDDCVDAGCHLHLCQVFRTRVSPGSLDVRATAWPGTPAENGTDELTACEGQDLSKNETAGFYGIGLFQQTAKGSEIPLLTPWANSRGLVEEIRLKTPTLA